MFLSRNILRSDRRLNRSRNRNRSSRNLRRRSPELQPPSPNHTTVQPGPWIAVNTDVRGGSEHSLQGLDRTIDDPVDPRHGLATVQMNDAPARCCLGDRGAVNENGEPVAGRPEGHQRRKRLRVVHRRGTDQSSQPASESSAVTIGGGHFGHCSEQLRQNVGKVSGHQQHQIAVSRQDTIARRWLENFSAHSSLPPKNRQRMNGTRIGPLAVSHTAIHTTMN